MESTTKGSTMGMEKRSISGERLHTSGMKRSKYSQKLRDTTMRVFQFTKSRCLAGTTPNMNTTKSTVRMPMGVHSCRVMENETELVVWEELTWLHTVIDSAYVFVGTPLLVLLLLRVLRPLLLTSSLGFHLYNHYIRYIHNQYYSCFHTFYFS